MDNAGVTDDENMFVCKVLKKVKYPLFFHEPGYEFKIGLPVLHAKFTKALFVLKGKAVSVRGYATLFQELFDYVLRLNVLENSGILAKGEFKYGRNNFDLVKVIIVPAHAGVLKSPDKTVEIAVSSTGKQVIINNGQQGLATD